MPGWILSFWCPCWRLSMRWSNLHRKGMFLFMIMLQRSKFAKDSCILTIQILPQSIHLMFSSNSMIWLIAFTTHYIWNGKQVPWIFIFSFYKFYFMGYKFRCPWAKDVGDLRDFQWSCGCHKDILFKFFVSTHFEFVFIWVCLNLCWSK